LHIIKRKCSQSQNELMQKNEPKSCLQSQSRLHSSLCRKQSL